MAGQKMSVEEAELRADLAKIDLIMTRAHQEFSDDRLNLADVAAIQHAAEVFGVTRGAAYLRAKGLGCLSYQGAAPAPGSA